MQFVADMEMVTLSRRVARAESSKPQCFEADSAIVAITLRVMA